MDVIQEIDMNLLALIQNLIHNNILDKIMILVTTLGNSGLVWIVLSIILLLSKKFRRVGVMCVFSLLLTLIIGEGFLKPFMQRPRPFLSIPMLEILIKKPLTYSFPSGHAASSFAMVGIMWNKMRKLRIPILVLAILISFSRLYLKVHYPSDVLAGILLGLFCSKIVLVLYAKS